MSFLIWIKQIMHFLKRVLDIYFRLIYLRLYFNLCNVIRWCFFLYTCSIIIVFNTISSRLSGFFNLKISRCIIGPNGKDMNPPPDHRFAKIFLVKILQLEGNAGYLIQRNCDGVVLSPCLPNVRCFQVRSVW